MAPLILQGTTDSWRETDRARVFHVLICYEERWVVDGSQKQNIYLMKHKTWNQAWQMWSCVEVGLTEFTVDIDECIWIYIHSI